MSLNPPDDSSARSISVPVDLDDDGFLRRECPHCEREFKWLYSPDDSEPVPVSGYSCPYCAGQADTDSWFTKAQVEYLAAVGLQEFAGSSIERLERSVQRLNRRGGLISARLESDIKPPVKPAEPNDMRRVDFTCHPKEPVKVADDWTDGVHCLVCGVAE